MDILLVSRCLPYPLHHGDRLIVAHVVEALRARGHRFDLVGLYLDDRDLVEMSRWKDEYGSVETVRERRRSALAYLRRLARPFPESAERCWNPEMWEAVRRRLSARRYDLIHFFGGVQVYEYRNLVRAAPKIIVPYESHALFVARARAAAVGARARARLRVRLAMARRYEQVMYRGFDRVVLVTEEDAAYLRGLQPGLPTVVIPNGVDTRRLRPPDGSVRTAALAFLGNYEYGPNVSAALALVTEVLPRVRAEVPEARVVLVGANPPAALTSLAGRDVAVTGWVSDVRPYLAEATCFVAPLTEGAGIRNKILEAMAMGVPVVATRLSCDGIAVTPGEDVLLGRTPEELAGAVIRLFRDGSLRARVAAGGRRLVERRYTWERVAAMYEAMYDEVIAGRAG